MKKIVFTLVAMMSLTFAYAEDENANKTAEVADAAKYEMNINVKSLSYALKLDAEETDEVAFISRNFAKDMAKAGAATGDERDELYKKAITRNLSDMRTVLTGRQYHEYIMLLNTTLNNRGLNK